MNGIESKFYLNGPKTESNYCGMGLGEANTLVRYITKTFEIGVKCYFLASNGFKIKIKK